MYYLVNGYRFITQKNECVQQDIWEANFSGCVTKLRKKSAAKNTIKIFPAYFFHEFICDIFQTDPIQTLKIMLAYFSIIKTIKNLLPLRVLDAFLALLRVLLVYAPNWTKNVVSLQFLTSFELKFNLTKVPFPSIFSSS